MKILFFTFPEGHLVSDKEFARLHKGFAKEGMELIRWRSGTPTPPPECDIVMVKGFSATWKDVMNLGKPVVYYSIGTEFKEGIDIQKENEPIRELFQNAQVVVHVSKYCAYISELVFGKRDNQHIIYPAEEAKLPEKYDETYMGRRLKLATTCIPRPVKRLEETQRLCEKYDIDLIVAQGTTDDFSYYYECDGYIHLSRKEGMPNTMLEAIAYGLPCISTNHGGSKEIAQVVIDNDPPYILWDPDNIEPIDDLLFESAIHHFKMNLGKYRMTVRERVLTELNDRVCAKNFKTIFRMLLK